MGAPQQVTFIINPYAFGPPGPTILVSDAFNRADGPLGNADTGHTWSGSGAGPAGTYSISSNRVLWTRNSGGAGFAVKYVDAGVSDVTIQGTFVTVKNNDGLWFRGSSADGFLYVSVGSKYVSYRVAGGGFTLIFDGAGLATPTNGDVLKVAMSGSSISFFVNGSQIGSPITDTFHQTLNTNYGFYGDNDSTADGAVWDNFTVTSP